MAKSTFLDAKVAASFIPRCQSSECYSPYGFHSFNIGVAFVFKTTVHPTAQYKANRGSSFEFPWVFP